MPEVVKWFGVKLTCWSPKLQFRKPLLPTIYPLRSLYFTQNEAVTLKFLRHQNISSMYLQKCFTFNRAKQFKFNSQLCKVKIQQPGIVPYVIQ